MAEDDPGIEVPIIWAGVEDVPMLYANTFICQFDPTSMGAGTFIITAGQLTPPALVGTPDEVKEQAEQVSYVPVRAVARLVVNKPKMDEFIAVLQDVAEKFEKARSTLGKDPRLD